MAQGAVPEGTFSVIPLAVYVMNDDAHSLRRHREPVATRLLSADWNKT